MSGAAHRQLLRGGAGEIDDSAPTVWPPVIDLHQDYPAIRKIGYLGPGAERPTPMGGGEGAWVEAFAARGLLAVKTRPIPGCLARLGAARIRIEGNGGEREGCWQYDG